MNLSGSAGYEEAKWGYDALLAKHDREAARWLRDAARLQPKAPEIWFDLGIAYQRLGNSDAARKAYRRAHELAPTDPDYPEAVQGSK
jgi:Flp pilus assembly protein TadD